MKKMISLLAAAAIFIASVPSALAANVSYMADFESSEAKFGKSVIYPGTKNNSQDYSDYIKPSWVEGQGKNNSAGLEINYLSATYYAGEIFFPLPKVWGNGDGAQYLNFDYNGTGVLKLSFSTQNIEGYTVGQGIKYSYTLKADTNGQWQSISIPLQSFVNGAEIVNLEEINLFTLQAGESAGLDNKAASTKEMSAAELNAAAKAGSIILDNMELSDVGENIIQPTEPPEPEKPDKTRVIDFDNYSLSHKQTWSGFKNNANDYTDVIRSSITENGKDGKGFEITYKAATYYSGEIFTAVPSKWATDENSEYLEFDANGRGVININLETDEVINGTRYGQKVNIDTNGGWQRISLPLSKFVNGGNSVVLSDVIGMTFTAGESGGLSNNDAETKAMSASELEEKAKIGTVVIDNITLAEKSSITAFTADFEKPQTSFGNGTVWSGFKNTANDYSDFIRQSVVSGEGADGSKGFKIDYQSATRYAGEVFLPIPQIWQNAVSSKYLSFDYNGKGAVKISFSTGNKNDISLTGGTRYTRRFELDSHGGWAKISVPLSEFVNGEQAVRLEEIGAVTFQAAEDAGLSDKSDDTKAMSAAELEERAKTGSIILDNMTLSDEEGETTLFTDVKITAEQNGAVIDKLSDGDITVKAEISGLNKKTSVTVAAAIYDGGILDVVKLVTAEIENGDEITLGLTAVGAENKTMKVFVFDDFKNLHPMTDAANF